MMLALVLVLVMLGHLACMQPPTPCLPVGPPGVNVATSPLPTCWATKRACIRLPPANLLGHQAWKDGIQVLWSVCGLAVCAQEHRLDHTRVQAGLQGRAS